MSDASETPLCDALMRSDLDCGDIFAWQMLAFRVEREFAAETRKREEAEREVVRLNTWADGMSDRVINERRTAEAHMQELRDRNTQMHRNLDAEEAKHQSDLEAAFRAFKTLSTVGGI